MPPFSKTAVPAARSSLPVLAIRRRVVIALLILAVLSGMFSTVAWLRAAARPAVTDNSSGVSAATALAEVAARDFLAQRLSTVPAAADVTNDFSTQGAAARAGEPFDVASLSLASSRKAVLGTSGDQQVQLVTFLVVLNEDVPDPNATAQGAAGSEATQPAPDAAAGNQEDAPATATVTRQRAYELTITLSVNDPRHPVLAAAPALVPAPLGTNGKGKSADYSNFDGGDDSAPAGVQSVVEAWATTFAAQGDASIELKRLTGDSRPDTRYSGLGGWTASNVAITKVLPVTSPTEGFVVRAALDLASPATNGPTVRAEYDLYVEARGGADATPFVVAWSPAGSVSSLEPYMNAN